MREQLFFIALLFPAAIAERMQMLKQEFADDYGSRHALRNPPHITLCPPYKANGQNASEIKETLQKFMVRQMQFTLKLNGFGAFPPRVIYIQPEHNKMLQSVYKAFRKLLTGRLHFSKHHLNSSLKPHVTLAYRDLTKQNFDKAWPIFSKRAFHAECTISSAHILKHNGKTWIPITELPFSAQVAPKELTLF